jgi:hypothetical protein
MPRYTIRARNQEGAVVIEDVQAPSAQAALAGMTARGRRDPELMYDNSATGAVLPPHKEAQVNELTAEDRGVLSEPKTSGRFLFDATLLVARKGWIGLTLAAGYLSWRRWQGHPFGIVDLVVIAGMLAPFVILFQGHLRGPAAKLRAYEVAMVEGRYAQAQDLARAAAGALQPMVAAYFAAKPLAAMGRLDEALALLEPHRSEQPDQKLAYLTQVSILYGNAKRFEEQRSLNEELIALATDKTIHIIGAAQIDLICFGRVDAAEAGLAPCREKPLPTFATFLWPMVDGIIALERGDHHRAAVLLEAAERDVRAKIPTLVALTSTLSVIEAYQVLISVATGRAEEGRAHFRAEEARLTRHLPPALLARCRAAIAA